MPRQVQAKLLNVLSVMRNAYRTLSWDDLRHALLEAYQMMTAVGSSALDAQAQTLERNIRRGDRLAATPGLSSTAVLDMFTGMLPHAHGVSKDLFAADVQRCRKAVGAASPAATLMAGPSAFSPGPLPLPHTPLQQYLTTAATVPVGVQPTAGSGSTRQPRRKRTIALPFPQGASATAGHYTPASGPKGGGRGRAQAAAASSPAAPQPPPNMSFGHYQMIVDVRNKRNAALQAAQVAQPGVPGSVPAPCKKCQAAGRDPHHDYLTCAFWICSNCKEAGHRRKACPNPFAP